MFSLLNLQSESNQLRNSKISQEQGRKISSHPRQQQFDSSILKKQKLDANESAVKQFSNPQYRNSKKQRKSLQKNLNIQQRIDDNLQGSKFRMLNEFLYKSESEKAFQYFQENPQDFAIYHEGFQKQTEKWPEQPISIIIDCIEKNKEFQNKTICDLGCGTGKLYQHFYQRNAIERDHKNQLNKNLNDCIVKRILSYDLIKNSDFIEAVDMKNLPLKQSSVDIVIFCLALMGTNYLDFILEASRVLKVQGYLMIAEVTSRFTQQGFFVKLLENIGYKQKKTIEPNSFFVVYVFQKEQIAKCSSEKIIKNPILISQIRQKFQLKNQEKSITFGEFSKLILKPCEYKKR